MGFRDNRLKDEITQSINPTNKIGNLKTLRGVGEMAHWVKHLLPKCENLNLDPQHQNKSLGGHMSITPVLR